MFDRPSYNSANEGFPSSESNPTGFLVNFCFIANYLLTFNELVTLLLKEKVYCSRAE